MFNHAFNGLLNHHLHGFSKARAFRKAKAIMLTSHLEVKSQKVRRQYLKCRWKLKRERGKEKGRGDLKDTLCATAEVINK